MGLILGLPENNGERSQLIRELAGRDGWHCVWCSCHLGSQRAPTLEHLIPRAQQGSDGQANLLLACAECNGARGDEDPRRWRDLCLGRGLQVRQKLLRRRLAANDLAWEAP
jgi:5-methylcytosine-specific restriction endonuclease McrA